MVTLTSDYEQQCLRWDCRRQPEIPLEYCDESCLEMANSDSQSEFPFCLANYYASVSSSLSFLQGKSCQWLFIGSHQIPVASGFKWVQGRSRIIDGVRHCILNPSPREDNRWKIQQYSRPDVMGKAVYVMQCRKLTHHYQQRRKMRKLIDLRGGCKSSLMWWAYSFLSLLMFFGVCYISKTS